MSDLEKKLKTRVILKHATEEDWNKSSLCPLVGEIIIYDPDESHPYIRYKRGREKLFENEETHQLETRVDDNGKLITMSVNELPFEPYLHIGTEAPANPPVGMLWLDTTETTLKSVEGVSF